MWNCNVNFIQLLTLQFTKTGKAKMNHFGIAVKNLFASSADDVENNNILETSRYSESIFEKIDPAKYFRITVSILGEFCHFFLKPITQFHTFLFCDMSVGDCSFEFIYNYDVAYVKLYFDQILNIGQPFLFSMYLHKQTIDSSNVAFLLIPTRSFLSIEPYE